MGVKVQGFKDGASKWFDGNHLPEGWSVVDPSLPVPEIVEDEKAKREAAERFGKIKVTVHLIMESGNDDEKSSNGVPTVAAVSEAFGEKVSGSEIKMAHEEIMKSAEPEK